MQFYALNNKHQLINAQQAEKHCNYICIECGTNLRLRAGTHRQKHFYHLESVRNCSLRKKGMVHLQLQNYLYQLLPVGDCLLEYRFTEINRIADVAWLSKKIVFEVQCSPISFSEISQRNHDYQSQGWIVIWILHDHRYNKKMLSSAEIALQNSPYYFSDMNADGKGIIYDQFEILNKNERIQRLDRIPVNLAEPKFWVENEKKAASCTVVQKRVNWPLYFGGDLMDVRNSEYFQMAMQMQKEHSYLLNNIYFKEKVKNLFNRFLFHPYRVVFRYFLEKACR